MDISIRHRHFQNTLKKQGAQLNPQKRFRTYQTTSEEAQTLKKRTKKSTKPSKVLPVYREEEPLPAKPFLKFRTTKKYETSKASYETLVVLY